MLQVTETIIPADNTKYASGNDVLAALKANGIHGAQCPALPTRDTQGECNCWVTQPYKFNK
jgi:hypothetical protein